jgi:hypothetical protein
MHICESIRCAILGGSGAPAIASVDGMENTTHALASA